MTVNKFLITFSIFLVLGACGSSENDPRYSDAATAANVAAESVDTVYDSTNSSSNSTSNSNSSEPSSNVEVTDNSIASTGDFEVVLRQAYIANNKEQVLSRIYDAEKGTYCYMYNSTALGCK